MKKAALTIISALFFGMMANAQTVSETVAPFNKDRKPAFTMQLDYSKKLVEEALANRLKKDKLKSKSEGGMTKYAQANYPAICAQQCDFYTKVDGTSKIATIYLFVSKGYNNFVSSGDDEDTAARVKSFLLSLVNDVRDLDLKYQIDDQTKVSDKAQKDYEKLVDQKAKLEKDLRDTENAIKQADSNRQQQKAILDQLTQKRASGK
ncbi:MAG: hypothetical protein IKR52_01055 [Paludibacteraceae bacterium]|nr:hypothetical protein [Paludibacteraceae bacterium]MBR6309776.1 hypothetical protein [Paludibacteraceae bacterium]MDD6357029.1 hypothetical protein [Bacteroidales bacterium]